jgi:hypothetical protein
VGQRWVIALGRAVLAASVVFVLAHVSLPALTPQWIVFGQVPILVLVLVLYVGKLLYDTMFFDRYH